MGTNKKAKVLPEPSDDFKEAVTNSGSVAIDCELCGRTYFCSEMLHTGDSEDAKHYENLLKKAKEEPDKYIELSDYISWGTIDGKQAVIDCKCHELTKYENIIWAHRFIIANYLQNRSQREAKAANQQAKALSDILVK